MAYMPGSLLSINSLTTTLLRFPSSRPLFATNELALTPPVHISVLLFTVSPDSSVREFAVTLTMRAFVRI